MLEAADVLRNPVSGESMRFLRRADQTTGAVLEWEHILAPGARVPRDHVHKVQRESFEILSGKARVRLGKETLELHPGDAIEIPPGMAHGLRNDTEEELRVRCELTPAGRTEEYFAIVCALAANGKVTRSGIPGALRLARISRSLGMEDYLVGLPIPLQQASIATLAGMARLLGLRVGP